MTTSPITMSNDTLKTAVDSYSRLLNETTRLGVDMLNTWTNLWQSSLNTAPGQLTQSAQSALDALQNVSAAMPLKMGSSCCKIPPPCWLPRHIGDVISHVCPGATAVLRLCITNCSFSPRTITIETPAASNIVVTPASLTLGPLERKSVTLSLAVSAEKGDCDETRNFILVKGCRQHYLVWTTAVSKRGGCTCHEVEVEDCQDYVHHWYDHFYCNRPCLSTRTGGQ